MADPNAAEQPGDGSKLRRDRLGIGTDARLEARIEAAAEWLMCDDSAYGNDRDAAMRAARAMLEAADEIAVRFEAASQRAIAILDRRDAPDAL